MKCLTHQFVASLMLAWIVHHAAAVHADEGPTPLNPQQIEQVLKAQKDRVETIRRISACTLAVFGPAGGGGGSGVVISPDGYALTNYHVAKPCGDYMRCGMDDGKMYDAVIVGIDPTGDVALIKLLGRDDFPTAKMGDSDALHAGDWCFVVGNPFLLATDFRPTVTYGIVSGTHRYQYPAGTLLEYADCIQTDASINPGNSGGPLFNAAGELVGINGRGSFEKRGRVNVGVGYAISINQIKKFYGYLKSGRVVDHATLGATVSTDDDGVVYVSDIIDDCDAYRRGLRYEDQIIAFGGRAIRSANEFKNILGTYPRGWQVPLSYRRDGNRYDIFVRLMGVHSREELIQQVQGGPSGAAPGQPPKGDKPDHPDKDDQDDSPKAPAPDAPKPRRPAKQQTKAKKIPAEVQALLQSRRGYANYHFNKKHRERIWNAYSKRTNLLDRRGEWVLSGTLENENGVFEIILRDDESFLDIPQGEFRITLSRDLDEELAPKKSGGVLLAISMWRRLLTLGPDAFGEVFYLGTFPMIETGDDVDVLVATHDAIEMQFCFDPDTGQMLKFELFPSIEHDTCRILLGGFGNLSGDSIEVPRKMTASKGDQPYAEFNISRIQVPEIKKGTTEL